MLSKERHGGVLGVLGDEHDEHDKDDERGHDAGPRGA
jgi:hypothetical protein